MSGEELKERICKLTGLNQAEIARRLGRTPQAVNSLFNGSDVRSGLIEEVCTKLDIPIPQLYGGGISATIAGDGNTQVAGNGNQIGITGEAFAALRSQLEIKDKQIDRLMGLLENR